MTPHGETFDFGGITAEAVRTLRRGVPALEAGGLAGLIHGIAGLPPAWLAALQDAERVMVLS